ncbi:rhomboid family intramembrane serine protease [Enterococcus italicus]|uniref:rhomboid family intramembrane serine protease n=1 Tax=Enterococcus italicus TaxID=246144 RepID=UPI0020730D00|nr:rhomboid family intramembrane serine protease [Enterococcus italicus]
MNEYRLRQFRGQPFFTWLFLGIQTLVFLIGYFLPNIPLESNGVLYGPAIAFLHQYWRFLTPIFFHFGLMHFAVNSVVLYYMGEQIEAIYGHTRFFIIYLVTGIMGNLMSFAFNTAGIISAGSSTALFGLFGSFIILGFHLRHNPAIEGMVKQFTLFLILSFVFGMFDQSIDIWGHVGGLIGGVLIGNIIGLPKPAKKYSIHIRILSLLILVFFVILCVMYGLKKYG